MREILDVSKSVKKSLEVRFLRIARVPTEFGVSERKFRSGHQ
jgi:hypothetical protein